ncbi:MAG TPA: aromatase/cyclase [Streptosporangiaceae bacterium]|nr:aromatase/cyclase [Streptosporangiaceae bacterium]
MPDRLTVTHHAKVNAPAQVIFDLLADVERWPQFFLPGVHAEYLEREPGSDLVARWALAGDQVRRWVSRRTLDRAGLSIHQEQAEPVAPVTAASAHWSLAPQGETATLVEVRHDIETTAGKELLAGETDRNGQAQLDSLAETAENYGDLSERVISFEDSLFIGGDTKDVYAFLYEADKWPQRVDHVSRIDMTEDVPNVQFFDMDTATPDGVPHTTRSVRLCFPHDLIVYKQTKLPALLDAHTGHWKLTATPEGTVASARHTATIKRSALPLLGDGTTVAGARRYLRRVLAANSLNTLRCAKAYAEERAGV